MHYDQADAYVFGFVQSGVCKDVKVKEHEGYTWGAINNFVYGYT